MRAIIVREYGALFSIRPERYNESYACKTNGGAERGWRGGGYRKSREIGGDSPYSFSGDERAGASDRTKRKSAEKTVDCFRNARLNSLLMQIAANHVCRACKAGYLLNYSRWTGLFCACLSAGIRTCTYSDA